MKEVLNDFVDVSVMKQELQRVVPQLKMVIRSNLKVNPKQ
jgi:hypothetical protein